MPRTKDGLTPKQAKFVEEYLVDLNATQAAVRAGYSAKNADVDGPKLLGNPRIAAVVAERQQKLIAKTGLQRERILREVELMAHSCVSHYVVDEFGNLGLAPGAPADAMQAVRSIKKKRKEWSDGKGDGHTVEFEVEFTLWDKPGMVKLAGRHKAIEGFSDRIEAPTDTAPTDVEVYTGLAPDDDMPAGAGRA